MAEHTDEHHDHRDGHENLLVVNTIIGSVCGRMAPLSPGFKLEHSAEHRLTQSRMALSRNSVCLKGASARMSVSDE